MSVETVTLRASSHKAMLEERAVMIEVIHDLYRTITEGKDTKGVETRAFYVHRARTKPEVIDGVSRFTYSKEIVEENGGEVSGGEIPKLIIVSKGSLNNHVII